MSRPTSTLTAIALLLAVGSTTAVADNIVKTDGTSIDDVTVQTDGIQELVYKSGSAEKIVPANQILRVVYSRPPAEIDRAMSARGDGQFLTAIGDLETYLEELANGRKERKDWAPALARHMLIELHEANGNLEGVIAAADDLITKSADSRFVPAAYIAKSDAQAVLKKTPQAIQTLDALVALIDQRGLSPDLKLEADLGRVLYDEGLSADQRRGRLEAIATQAGTKVPTVRNRALLAIGQDYVAATKLADAEKSFREIVKSGQADDATMAAAYSGLGDCLFARASAAPKGSDEAKAGFRDATLAFLRVPVLYRDQVDYVPRALFFAGRSLDLMGESGREDAVSLYRRLNVLFPGNNWAKEAQAFL